MNGEMYGSFSAWRAIASATRLSPWPMFTPISWELKSRYRLPSASQKETPSARSTAIGDTFDWADQSYRVYRFDFSTISAAVIGRSSGIGLLLSSRGVIVERGGGRRTR